MLDADGRGVTWGAPGTPSSVGAQLLRQREATGTPPEQGSVATAGEPEGAGAEPEGVFEPEGVSELRGVAEPEEAVGAEVPPPPMTRCTVPRVVSMRSARVSTGIGVRVSVASVPRTGCDRS